MLEYHGAIQLCRAGGTHSKLYENENEILELGWIAELNFSLCPECRDALFEMIRIHRKGYAPLDTRIEKAVQLAAQYGMTDGAHHKQWVIDQMVRLLLENEYESWVKSFNIDEDYDDWDTGIAP